MKLAGLTLLRGFSRTVLGIMAGWSWSLALDAPWVLELYVMLTVLPIFRVLIIDRLFL